jgi:uncharacterized protein
MINPATVAFDFDGVIADTMTLFLDIARSEYCIQGIRYDDITCYALSDCLDVNPEILKEIGQKIVEGDYAVPLKSFEGAAEVLIRLAERHPPVLCVTARPYSRPVGKWVRENFYLDSRQVEVVATGTFDDKASVLLHRNITHYVEDRLETCFALQDAGIVPILYRQPWNRKPHQFIEVGCWAELEQLIDFNG